MNDNELFSISSLDGTDTTADSVAEVLPSARLEYLPQLVQDACMRAGWTGLMPVQALCIPYLLEKRDCMIQSRTGSGKTGTYLLPLLPRLDCACDRPQVLILVPTRELALQVEREAKTLLGDTGLRAAALYGGVGYGKQMEALRKGAHLVVGTPGRVLDHLLRRTLSLDGLHTLIFDEADRMLSIGFYPDMKEVQRYLPRNRVHTCLFSATYPPHVLRLAREFMEDAILLSLSQQQVHVAEVRHMFCECKAMDKDRVLVRLLETENPASAIIFCNTKTNVHYVAAVLQGFGYNAQELSADLSQSRRESVLRSLLTGETQFLVATDVAARGIDIPELSHVFLYEPPEDQESYIHRAGRTGRAGAAGTVIALVDVMQRLELERIARTYKISLEAMPVPTEDAVAAAVGNRLMTVLEARHRKLTGLQKERLQRFVPLVRQLTQEAGEGGESQEYLLGMLLDACYQKSLRALPAPTGREGKDSTKKTGIAHAAPKGQNNRKRQSSSRRRKPQSSQG